MRPVKTNPRINRHYYQYQMYQPVIFRKTAYLSESFTGKFQPLHYSVGFGLRKKSREKYSFNMRKKYFSVFIIFYHFHASSLINILCFARYSAYNACLVIFYWLLKRDITWKISACVCAVYVWNFIDKCVINFSYISKFLTNRK